jgi:NAD(P)-dependent dehydrogenase (short-subunit alcohol dehydrogenase family)
MEKSEFEGKVVLITGGGGGALGPAIAEAYVARGASVVLCDKRAGKSAEKATRLQSKARNPILAFDVDIGDREAVESMVGDVHRRLGRVDILIGNAAEVVFEPFDKYTMEASDRVVEVDLTANFLLAKLVLPGMVERKGGNLLFIGSVASWIHASDLLPGEFSYAVAKSALLTLTRTLAAEFGRHGIRCNGIAPGLIESGFTRGAPDFTRAIAERTPMRMIGAPEDIVESALFLTSDRLSRFITGETLNVSGGLHMRV